MLAGLAMKWRWRARAERPRAHRPTRRTWSSGPTSRSCGRSSAGTGTSSRATSRCTRAGTSIEPDEVIARIDENTIGVVAILGTTFTGEFEPIEEIHDRDRRAQRGDRVRRAAAHRRGERRVRRAVPAPAPQVGLPAAEGRSRSTCRGTSTGSTYPGVGFVVWRSAAYLPEDLVFHVNYLGGDMPTFTLNFSRPGNQIVGQYYNFLRLGHAGYAPDHARAPRPRGAHVEPDRRARTRSSSSATVPQPPCSPSR